MSAGFGNMLSNFKTIKGELYSVILPRDAGFVEQTG